MNTSRKFTRMLVAACTAASLGTAASAAPTTAATECGLIGAWSGYEANDLYWLGVHTAGTYPSEGVMSLDWRYVNPNLLAGAARLTNGYGVWEQVRRGQYRYTWYAYGVDSEGQAIYSVRVSGLAKNTDCNNVEIGYTYEIFYPSVEPNLMSSSSPVDVKTGTSYQTRLPLAVPTTP